jgi:hypothetical protein
MTPEALMPPPLNAKVNESALAVCVLVRVPATTRKAGKIQRDSAFIGIALPDVRHESIDDGVFSQNEIFTCFSLKLLRMIDRGLNKSGEDAQSTTIQSGHIQELRCRYPSVASVGNHV